MKPNSVPAEQAHRSRRVRELEMLIEITRRLNSTLDVDDLLRLISRLAAQLVDCVDASIILEDKQTGELVFLAAASDRNEHLKSLRVPIEGSIAGTVFKSQEPLVVQDTERDPRHYGEVDDALEFVTESILAVPMMFKGAPIGVLEAINKLDAGRFDEHDVNILSILAAQAAVAIENARLVTELQEANTQLADLDRLKSGFIAIASHELRTPLALILGYASFLREDTTGTTSDQLDMVLQAATQLNGLIEDMVSLSHLEAGSMDLDLSEFNLQDIIRECIEAQQALAATKSLNIRCSLGTADLHVRADREKIHFVLNNLLNNAIKFTPEGGRIQLAARQKAGMAVVSVSDTGVGVPQEDLNRIFDRFHQVESHFTRRESGMGLGLSIARGMVELHGGRIWTESVIGRGSRFTFTLPALWPNADLKEG